MFRFSRVSVFVVALICSFLAQADTMGPLDGRSAVPGSVGEMSAEVGYISEGDLTTIAGRLNYQLSPVLSVYANYGLVDFFEIEGNALGLGVRYYLTNQKFLPEFDAAVRASYHTATFDATLGTGELELTEMTFALHLSGKEPISANGMKWYGVVSYNRQATGDLDPDTEVGFGGGINLPFGPGEAYVGIENVEEMFIGVGYRHFLGGSN